MVEEDEGANHAPLRIWQHAPDLKPTEVAAALMDHKLDHVRSPRELPPSPFLHAGGEHEGASADLVITKIPNGDGKAERGIGRQPQCSVADRRSEVRS
jgi:hypothetical protein